MKTGLQEIPREVGAAANLPEILDIVVRRVRDAVDLDACAVYLIDLEAEQYVLMAAAGIAEFADQQIRLERPNSLLGQVEERGELVSLTGLAAHGAYPSFITEDGGAFATFVGMPLVHHQRVIAILVGLKHASSPLDPDELTFIVTFAARIASTVHDAVATYKVERLLKGETQGRSFIQGTAAAPGLAVGIAISLNPASESGAVTGTCLLDVAVEETALRTAVAAACRDLELVGDQLSKILPDDAREMTEAYLLLLRDDRLLSDTVERIRAGSRARDAWRETIRHYAQAFEQMEDAYLRTKADDIREIGQRVLLQLGSRRSELPTYPDRCILVADYVGITDIAAVPAGRLAGILCRRGSALSHMAILANALSIPAVVQLTSLPDSLINGFTIAIDGDRGRVFVNPSSTTVEIFNKASTERRERAEAFATQRGLPARTPDGVSVPLLANVGLSSDVDSALADGADGVGLLRTEYQFLLHEGFPIEEEQYRHYLDVLKSFAPRPVSVRTLDVGGDKILSYFPVSEDNPMLGCRGIRFSLAHPEIFLIQLRALLRANASHGNLQILFPMISLASELNEALHLLERAHRELLEEGVASAMPKVGIMIEVPSAVYLTKTLADRVGFFAIGSNDLTQYILAVDRTNAEVTNPDDALHPAVLDAMYRTVVDAHEQNRPVSVCGELAGDPAGALLLLGLGVDSLSMSPTALARVKRVIRIFTAERARTLAMESLGLEDGNAVRQHLNRALRDAGVL